MCNISNNVIWLYKIIILTDLLYKRPIVFQEFQSLNIDLATPDKLLELRYKLANLLHLWDYNGRATVRL